GGRETAKAPGLLVPTAPDDPWPLGMSRCIVGDLLLRFGKGSSAGEIDRQEAEAQAHHVHVRIDDAGDDGAASTVLAIVGARRALAFSYELADFAFVIDQYRFETGNRAVAIDCDAVDVVDQGVGEKGCGEEQRRRCKPTGPHAPTSGRCRISALVSCRPPPIAWTLA